MKGAMTNQEKDHGRKEEDFYFSITRDTFPTLLSWEHVFGTLGATNDRHGAVHSVFVVRPPRGSQNSGTESTTDAFLDTNLGSRGTDLTPHSAHIPLGPL